MCALLQDGLENNCYVPWGQKTLYFARLLPEHYEELLEEMPGTWGDEVLDFNVSDPHHKSSRRNPLLSPLFTAHNICAGDVCTLGSTLVHEATSREGTVMWSNTFEEVEEYSEPITINTYTLKDVDQMDEDEEEEG